jgi:hypothetical protein
MIILHLRRRRLLSNRRQLRLPLPLLTHQHPPLLHRPLKPKTIHDRPLIISHRIRLHLQQRLEVNHRVLRNGLYLFIQYSIEDFRVCALLDFQLGEDRSGLPSLDSGHLDLLLKSVLFLAVDGLEQEEALEALEAGGLVTFELDLAQHVVQ